MASTDARQDPPSLWSPWGDRLLAAMAVGLALCAAWWLIGTSYLDLPLSTYLSWKPWDTPTPVPPNVPEALLGWHYFGDFQESRWWGVDILHGRSPYRYFNIYPPFATVLMVPFAAIPLAPAWAIYVVLTVAALLVPAWLLLRDVKSVHRVIVVALVGAATAPFLATIDRGNLQGLTIGLVGMALVALQRSRVRWALLLLVVAICLKPFVIVLALFAIARRRRTFATNTIALVLLLSFAAVLVLPGNPIDTIGLVLQGQEKAIQGPAITVPSRLWANISINGLVANVEYVFGRTPTGKVPEPSLPHLGTSLTLAWLALALIVAWRRRLPQWVWACLALASLQLAQPYAAMYTASWATLAAIWFGAGQLIPTTLVGTDNDRDDTWLRSLRVLVLAALVVTLLPLAVRPEINGTVLPVQQVLGPLLWVIIGIVALTASFVRKAPQDWAPVPRVPVDSRTTE